MRKTSAGVVLIETYVDETHVTVFSEDGWSMRDGLHPGELWEALFYVAGVEEDEAKRSQADIHADTRYRELESGTKSITAIALLVLAVVVALLVFGAIFVIDLVF